MPSYYADSSALVKRHVNELGSIWVQATLDTVGNTVVTSRISMAEVCSALNRRVREGSLDHSVYTTMINDFDALCMNEYGLVELTAVIIDRSRLLLEQHVLRAYDAVQLASALVSNATLLAAALPPLIFLSADDRLLRAAHIEGLAIDNPNAHP